MKFRNILGPGIFLCLVIFSGCRKENVNCTEEEAFCALVNEQNFEASEALIDNYLNTLTYDYEINDAEKAEPNLEKIKAWLECKSCVGNVRIRCNSCIYTYPAQSVLIVNFKTKKGRIKKVMDLRMGQPITVREFH